MTVETSVLIIGTGFAGLGMGIRLKQAGLDDFVILEHAETVGGTWRDNHYPGAACDIPSHLYSFSFEQNPEWSRSFGEQGEIQAYLEACADKYAVRSHIRFGSEVTRATFDERAGRWLVETKGGARYEARALVSGCGGLSRPSYPDVPGLATFAGKTFHSARWDHSFSLEGKRVGVIGTGASAVQIVPAIAPKVGRLAVFQRTASWIMPKPDFPVPDRLRATFRLAPPLLRFTRALLYWLLEWRAYGFVFNPRLLKMAEPQALRFLHAQVSDPVLREKLTPTYAMGCKRILLSNDYFETFARENVDLVTDAIDRVTPAGVRTKDGKEHALDALVCATGFQAAESAAPFEIRGRGGRELNEVWKDGAEAYLGTTVSGFPNLFLIVGPNTGLGHNSMVYIIESQIAYVLDAIRTMKKERLATMDVRADVQAAYNEKIGERLAKTVWSTGGCKAWYTTRDGKNTTLWPGFTFEFRYRTRRFDLESYAVAREKPESTRARASATPAASSPHVAADGAE